MKPDMSPRAIRERLQAASRMSDLAPEKRLDAKIDLSPAGVTKRLREASDLLRTCQALSKAGQPSSR
jgi:hypothetical protein